MTRRNKRKSTETEVEDSENKRRKSLELSQGTSQNEPGTSNRTSQKTKTTDNTSTEANVDPDNSVFGPEEEEKRTGAGGDADGDCDDLIDSAALDDDVFEEEKEEVSSDFRGFGSDQESNNVAAWDEEDELNMASFNFTQYREPEGDLEMGTGPIPGRRTRQASPMPTGIRKMTPSPTGTSSHTRRVSWGEDSSQSSRPPPPSKSPSCLLYTSDAADE